MKVLELIERIRTGTDPRGAQEKLYQLVRKVLLHRIRLKLPPRLKPRLDAEDVLDEAFIRSINSLDRFQAVNENSYFAWVYTISKNIIHDQSARRSAAAFHFTRSKDELGPRESRIVSNTRRPETHILRQDLIESALSRLREKEAEVIRLHRLEGKSFEEIATSWNKTPGSVQRFFSRAWQRFQEIVNPEKD